MALDVLMWILVIAAFIASFAGIIYPWLPSPLMIWIGLLLYQFFLNNDNLSVFFWVAMVVLTILLIVSDIIANSYFVKRFGGSKWGERIAAIGVIVGSFVFPPIGIIAVPFIGVLVTELVQRRTLKEAIYSSIGSLLGFLGGAVAKVIIQLIIVVWFFIAVFF